MAHRIHGAGIYANIGGYWWYIDGKCYIMLPYIAAPWILWALKPSETVASKINASPNAP